MDYLDQRLVLRLPMQAMVDLTVTAWADRTHKPWIIRPPVTEAASVVGLEVRVTLHGGEGRRIVAALANPRCPSEDVTTDCY